MAGWLGEKPVFALLARRDFALLWIGHTASILGDYLFFIAITFWVYARTGSSLATGAVLVSSALPLTLFAPLAGCVVDRFDRRRVMLLAEVARGILFLLTLLIIVWRPGALWPIYVVAFAQTALAAFYWPARAAILPQLAPGESLLAANALYQLTDGAARVVAPSLAALALLRTGAAGVVALDAATFVISAGCVAAMSPLPRMLIAPPTTVAPPSSAVAEPHDGSPGALVGEWRRDAQDQGESRQRLVSHVRKPRNPTDAYTGPLTAIYALGAAIALVNSALGVLLPIYVRASLHAGPLAYGWLFTAQALGDVVVSALLGRGTPTSRSTEKVGARVAISLSLVGSGVALIALALTRALSSALALSFVFGALTAFASVRLLTWLQRSAPAARLGRLLAGFAAAQAFAQLSGLGLAGLLGSAIGARRLIAPVGALLVASGGLVEALLTARWMFHVKHRP